MNATPPTLFDRPTKSETKSNRAPFPGWIERPDVDRRMGWEAPDTPETARWWTRRRFEDLPTTGET